MTERELDGSRARILGYGLIATGQWKYTSPIQQTGRKESSDTSHMSHVLGNLVSCRGACVIAKRRKWSTAIQVVASIQPYPTIKNATVRHGYVWCQQMAPSLSISCLPFPFLYILSPPSLPCFSISNGTAISQRRAQAVHITHQDLITRQLVIIQMIEF